ncbi:MoaD/ThiS family protein [Candidatus Bathyarchaeota archaeon]|nr:MAG: MoaD/ThiS family protein [Candidatus Bathyarchaeota archaeon]
MALIEMHLYGKLRRFSDSSDPRRESIIYVPLEEGDTIRDVIERIGIPLDELGLNIFLNGEYSNLSRPVRDGDRLGIFPDDMQLLYKWHFKKKG